MKKQLVSILGVATLALATIACGGGGGKNNSSTTGGVYVAGNDVYVAGWGDTRIQGEWYDTALLWKNGFSTQLGTGATESWANSISVSGNNVYVAGGDVNQSGDSRAILWKNGEAQRLPINPNHPDEYAGPYSEASSVFTKGSNTYVCGHHGDVATVWKDGAFLHSLQSATKERPSFAHSVFVK